MADVIPMPGTVTEYRLRAGPEFKWHCPLFGCFASGRFVKRRETAIQGLARHVEREHG